MVWNNPPGSNSFTLTYAPSPARLTITATGSTSGSQFYDFLTPVANPNLPFNNLLIELKAPQGSPQITITNLVLTVPGGSTTNLGTIDEKGNEAWALISDIGTAYTSGFTLTGSIVVQSFVGGSEENPFINFSGVFDRAQPFPDLTLTKTHSGNFTQGQTGATYTVTVRNIGAGPTSGTVTMVDNFPPALLPGVASGNGWMCITSVNTATCTRSDTLAPGASYPPITLTVNVASTAPASILNGAAVTGGNDGNSANNTVTDPTTIIRGPDLSITKTANGTFIQGQAGAGYTLTVSNTGGTISNGIVTVTDNLPTGLSPATIGGEGWTCSISGNTATCTRSDPRAPGASYPPIALTVNVAGNAPVSVTNTATVSGGGDLDASNNTASVVTPIARAPDLTISKSHTGNFIQGQTATYTITVTNIGPVPTNSPIIVADPMLLPLTPRTGSGSGWTCAVLLELIQCQRSDALAPGEISPPITMTASIATNAPPSIVNTATVSGGVDSNTSNNIASDTATVVPASDLTITKTHTGDFMQGQSGTYTLTVSNNGGSPTAGSITLIDTLPVGLLPTAASGTGWTCTISGQNVNCDHTDPMGIGQNSVITLTVSVQRNAAASLTNTATVLGGGETNPTNNTASDPTTIAAGPNLTITKSHTGNFSQGQTGTYTLTVTNTGASPTNATVVVTDNLPIGLASSGASGTGWSCTPGGQSFPCTRNDPLAPGASYPPIILMVEVAVDAPASATNTATVGGGGDVDTNNNSASDPTTIIAVSDLTITKTHTASFLQGQVGAQYALTVSNTGGGPTTSPVIVTDTVPAGLTPTAAAGAGWGVCNIAGQTVTCSRSDVLAIGANYPAITLTVNVAPTAPPSLTNTATVSGGGEINTANNTANDVTTIGPGPDLTISKSHSQDFIRGQTSASYTITVSNPGFAPTSGGVTVTDNVPAGMVPVSASGASWSCVFSGQEMTCTRSDALAAGTSYAAITLTVSVQPTAPATVTNTVTVSGGGDVNPANNSATDVTSIVPGADLTIIKSHTGNFHPGSNRGDLYHYRN